MDSFTVLCSCGSNRFPKNRRPVFREPKDRQAARRHLRCTVFAIADTDVPAGAVMICLAPVVLAVCLAGCAADPVRDVLKRESQVLEPAMLQRILRQAPVAADEDLRAEPLLESEEFSAYLLQFRTGEPRHIHREHDLTFVVYRGQGEVYINDHRRVCKPGDVFHIPRGTPHYCVNTGSEPLVVVNLFTPPFDVADRISLPRGSRSYERIPP